MPGTVEQKVVAYVRRGGSILVFVHVDDAERPTWEHVAPDGDGVARRFRCSWLPIEKAPPLAAAQGVFAPTLIEDP
jgi:hypothetical protein